MRLIAALPVFELIVSPLVAASSCWSPLVKMELGIWASKNIWGGGRIDLKPIDKSSTPQQLQRPHYPTTLQWALTRNRWYKETRSWWMQDCWRQSSSLYNFLLSAQHCGVWAGKNKEVNNSFSRLEEGRSWLYPQKTLIDVCQLAHWYARHN